MQKGVVFLFLLPVLIAAQGTLVIHKSVGSTEQYSLSEISKMAFIGDQMAVLGPNSIVPLSSISKMTFDLSTPVENDVGVADGMPFEVSPNPFNPSAIVRFSLKTTANVALAVFDIQGKRVAALRAGMMSKGTYTVEWDGKDDTKAGIGAGYYVVRLTVGDRVAAKKVLYLK